MDNTSWKV